ncbi:MAG: hypothetical protein A4E64_00066 [Syntrophorhabdus sp. PtaU1.Bin058]|nr:MAG: hypothetical protein A4E64_00066 [Syntrophorhabdus sp. PtaU1.Bin058]
MMYLHSMHFTVISVKHFTQYMKHISILIVTLYYGDLLMVKEFIEYGRNGLLCDFFSPKQIANRVDEILNHPDRMRYLGQAAQRDIVEKYEMRKKLAKYQALYLSPAG